MRSLRSAPFLLVILGLVPGIHPSAAQRWKRAALRGPPQGPAAVEAWIPGTSVQPKDDVQKGIASGLGDNVRTGSQPVSGLWPER
jgi:hypothetical protein